MNVSEFFRSLKARLTPKYGATEAAAMVRLIFFALKGWSATDIVCNEDKEVSDFLMQEVEGIMARIDKDEPLQYILGTARFYGMDLYVDRNVLIPRQETEELVDALVDRYKDKPDLRVLDIGTGSGAIAIALKRNLSFPQVTALDVSAGALKVAGKNASARHADISFIEADIFSWQPKPDAYNIIVSNPPYVCDSEKKEMDLNVLEYEPHIALFVPDNDPLKYYKVIADIAMKGLSFGGRLYLEINPMFADMLCEMLKNKGFAEVEVWKDISGRKRFASAAKLNEDA